MRPIDILNIILIIFVIYFFWIHPYILGRRKFKCLRCGRCCRLIVSLSKEDIKKIEKAGYKKENFIDKKGKLKKVNGYCIFLALNNGITSCKLENKAKPEICRNFPALKGRFGKKCDFRCRSWYKNNN